LDLMKLDVLIVDDKEKLCTSLKKSLQERGYSASYALCGSDAERLILSQQVRLVLLDVKLGNEDGLELLRDLLRLKPDVKVIMITGFATVDIAVDSLKLGAVDFIQKPISINKLMGILDKFLGDLEKDLDGRNSRAFTAGCECPHIVTQNDAMLQLLQKACSIADSDLPVLILGESGTGKELIADYIHYYSPRRHNDFIKINCSAFPETLLDNELFGHDKGAFTGANTVYKGVFERAHSGSLFLDELGDMPLFLQPKVLRAIQNKEIRRLGGKETIKVDVRFIASTNKDLQELMQKEKFREDLYYRLGAAQLYVPALRDKTNDISLLAEYFLERVNEKFSKPKELSTSVYERLMQHDWPGNIRELENSIRYSAVVSKTTVIVPDDLPPTLGLIQGGNESGEHDLEFHERKVIENALRKVKNNKKKAAELLNISRVTLYRKIDKYGIPTDIH
jgi:DNA-binding NtrC family response regulator